MNCDFEQFLSSQREALMRHDSRPLKEILADCAMPLPLWRKREPELTPEQAFPAALAAAEENRERAFCIYAHVPYCRSHCGYCDCYAFPLTADRRDEPALYTDLLCREIRCWGEASPALRERRLSTVHFGGGTPLTLGTEGLARVLDMLRAYFRVDAETELALESTSQDLTPAVLDKLRQLGFTRLHIGVQSLNDEVRRAIGRRENGAAVLEKIRYAVDSGWIVSTDLIVGLPDSREEDFEKDIRAMVEAGAEGISIYELVRSPRNYDFFVRHHIEERDLVKLWRAYQYAFWCAEAQGCRPLIYNHMAKGRDDNRYFTSPARGEDLLALGTIADGSFGNVLYRHAELADYRTAVENGLPGLTNGLYRTSEEADFARLERELRGGCPAPEPFIELLGQKRALTLFEYFLSSGFIKICGDYEHCELTPNGSWFINILLRETLKQYRKHKMHPGE